MIDASDAQARKTATDATALRILARSLVRELQQRGYGLRHIISLANELIGLACETIRSSPKTPPSLAHQSPGPARSDTAIASSAPATRTWSRDG